MTRAGEGIGNRHAAPRKPVLEISGEQHTATALGGNRNHHVVPDVAYRLDAGERVSSGKP
jgi:hypothetical protein